MLTYIDTHQAPQLSCSVYYFPSPTCSGYTLLTIMLVQTLERTDVALGMIAARKEEVERAIADAHHRLLATCRYAIGPKVLQSRQSLEAQLLDFILDAVG